MCFLNFHYRMSLPKYDELAFVFIKRGGLYCQQPLWPAFIVHVMRTSDDYLYMYEVEMFGDHNPRRVVVPETQIYPATSYRIKLYSNNNLHSRFQVAMKEMELLSEMIQNRQREVGRAQAIPRNLLPELDQIAREDRQRTKWRRFIHEISNGVVTLCRRIIFGWQ
ncbi:uncharacterized protein LOC124368562 [Homalodisca vitripennis]|uniref:uncharacterized protein LOC124368562 n=1 Tax=Homalodisca vitripennis TaxID=197043 RepID=UPI001EEA3651|nr:uncharacterized protein LOC124368562 [Homalodisca vitripennis]